jgi:hypothetical protein
MRPVETTKINGRTVPIEQGERTVVCFNDGAGGKHEAGGWEFWTAWATGAEGTTARTRPGIDPGERFQRMEGEPGYQQHWARASTATRLAPTTAENLISWLNSHAKDSPFATYCRVGGRTMRVVRIEEFDYRLEPVVNTMAPGS